jgi:hypothetical protein
MTERKWLYLVRYRDTLWVGWWLTEGWDFIGTDSEAKAFTTAEAAESAALIAATKYPDYIGRISIVRRPLSFGKER